MVASIITEHPRIESCFITSPSGRRGYPNYRPAFSHIKKVVLPKTSHLNKGWIRKSFAFFPSLPFWKVFCTFFSFWCFVLCWGTAVFFSGFAPRPCGGKIRSLVGFWEGSGGRNICYVSVCMCACVYGKLHQVYSTAWVIANRRWKQTKSFCQVQKGQFHRCNNRRPTCCSSF